jgi:hypothetical protein
MNIFLEARRSTVNRSPAFKGFVISGFPVDELRKDTDTWFKLKGECGLIFEPDFHDEVVRRDGEFHSFDDLAFCRRECENALIRFLSPTGAGSLRDSHLASQRGDLVRDAFGLIHRARPAWPYSGIPSEKQEKNWGIKKVYVMTDKCRVVPLLNFESKVKTHDFRNGVSLGQLTQPEANVLGSPYLIGETSHSNRSRTTFKLQLLYKAPESPVKKGTGPHQHELHQHLFDVVTALRLHKAGDFGVPVYIELNPMDEKQWEAGGFWGQAKRLGLPYELTDNDLNPVSTLSSEITRARSKADKRLDLALLRFGDTYGRNRSEDALVDGQIALESCLTPDSTAEIAYRLALRGAALLARHHPPAETRLLLNMAYEARSKLVHQGWSLQDCFQDSKFRKKVERFETMSGQKLLAVTFGDQVLGLVRGILKTVIQLLSGSSNSIAELIDTIDSQIANALQHAWNQRERVLPG